MTAKVDAFIVKIACVMPNGSVLTAARPQAARAMCTTAEPRGQLQNHVRQRRRSSGDRKSTRLNSSHGYISYAVFCLKKKKKKEDSARCSELAKQTAVL